MIKKLSIFVALLMLLFAYSVQSAQQFTLKLMNDAQISLTEYEFDIYLKSVGADPIYYSGTSQYIMSYNNVSMGVVVFTLNAGTSELNAGQIPAAAKVKYQASPGPYVVCLAGTISPPQTLISSTGNGTRIGRFKITVAAGFSVYNANVNFVTAGALRTKVVASPTDGGTAADISALGTMTNELANPPLPVQLASFTGSVENKRDAVLSWKTASETNNQGFEIERAVVGSGNLEFRKITFVSGMGTKNTPTSYSFDDKKLQTGKYQYRLKQIDNNGNFQYHNLSTIIEVGVPTKYDLSQNYPNPFNPTTKIDYDLPFDSKVTMILYDMTGREVKTLVNNTMTAGYYTEVFNLSNLSSGTYFYRLIAKSSDKDYLATKKMMLIK